MHNDKILKRLAITSQDKVGIFINKKTDMPYIFRVLKTLKGNSDAVFRLTAFDIELPSYFNDLGVKIDYSWDYLDDADCNAIDDFFFRKLAPGWLRADIFPKNDIYSGLKESLLRCTENNFAISNLLRIKYLEVIRKLFIGHAPNKILIVEDTPCLINVLRCFNNQYEFRALRISPKERPFIRMLNGFGEMLSAFLKDAVISFIDFFVWVYIMTAKGFQRKTVIDYRLYRTLGATELKDGLFVCHFEKGLKARLEMLKRGVFYLPLRSPSCLDICFVDLIKIFKLAAYQRSIKKDMETLCFNGIPVWWALNDYVKRALFITFPRVISNMNSFKRFASRKQVQLVVIRNDIKELERTIVEAARPLGMKTVVVQHGIFGDFNIGNVLLADVTAAWGRASIGWFKRYGYPEERFVITGNPNYDALHDRISKNMQKEVRDEVSRRLNLSSRKKIVTFLTSSNYLFCGSSLRGNTMSVMLRSILNALTLMPEVQLIIKFHPYDSYLDDYKVLIKNFNVNGNVATVSDFNIFDIIEASDAVITLDSSSGLEALILDKPLIVFKPHKISTTIPYAEEKAAIGVHSVDDMVQAMRDGLYNEEMKAYLKEKRNEFVLNYAYKIDGLATERIARLINEYITDKSSV